MKYPEFYYFCCDFISEKFKMKYYDQLIAYSGISPKT